MEADRAVTEPLFDYHPIDWLHGRYGVPPLTAAQAAAEREAKRQAAAAEVAMTLAQSGQRPMSPKKTKEEKLRNPAPGFRPAMRSAVARPTSTPIAGAGAGASPYRTHVRSVGHGRQWRQDFVALNGTRRTLIVDQGPAVENADYSAHVYDAVIDLRPSETLMVKRTQTGDEFAANYMKLIPKMSQMLDRWQAATPLGNTVLRRDVHSEAVIKSTTRLLYYILKLAFKKTGDMRVLCVCMQGKERSLLMLFSWITMADVMRQCGDAGTPLFVETLANIKNYYRGNIFALPLGAELNALLGNPDNKTTKHFEHVTRAFPAFYLKHGIAVQGNKTANTLPMMSGHYDDDIADDDDAGDGARPSSTLALSPYYTCAQCEEYHHHTATRQMVVDPRTYNVFCSTACGRLYRKINAQSDM